MPKCCKQVLKCCVLMLKCCRRVANQVCASCEENAYLKSISIILQIKIVPLTFRRVAFIVRMQNRILLVMAVLMRGAKAPVCKLTWNLK